MDRLLTEIQVLWANTMERLTINDIIDILIVAFMIYNLLQLTRETRANQVLKGVGIIIVAYFLSGVFRLQAFNWLLRYIMDAGAVVLVVLFQPELRRALEKIGADRVIIPERETGIKLAQSLTSSSILDFIELSPDCGIAEMQTPPEWCGKSIRELDIRAKYGVNVIAVRENGKVHVTVDANRPLNEHITLVLLGENDRLAKVKP